LKYWFVRGESMDHTPLFSSDLFLHVNLVANGAPKHFWASYFVDAYSSPVQKRIDIHVSLFSQLKNPVALFHSPPPQTLHFLYTYFQLDDQRYWSIK
jgi:hypothetical protein